jgi:thiosulfate/3-mercaptopyruvate sulfurtransferase
MSTNPIITTAWLHDQIAQPSQDLKIIDCRFALADANLGREQYQTAHIPGSHHLDLNRDLSSPIRVHGGRHPLPDPTALGDKLAAIGINSDTLVIIYDDSRFAFAARLWWLCRYYGHDRVAILNGGYSNWVKAGYPITADLPQPVQTGNFQARPQADWIVDIDEVRSIQHSPTHILIDSREPDRYAGKIEPIDPIAGHIPGAVNYPWQDVSKTDGFCLPVEAQQQRWAAITPAIEPIVYCGSGVTACVNLLSLSIAKPDLQAKLYPGSWSDWCSYQ